MVNPALSRELRQKAGDVQSPLPDRSIDLVFLAQQSLGDKGLEIELLTLFEKQSETIVGRLVKPVCSSDRKWQHDLAHTLKGSARAVGAVRVAQVAEDFEAAIDAGVSDDVLAGHAERLQSVVNEAREIILDLIVDQ